jgi:hypothetical protein
LWMKSTECTCHHHRHHHYHRLHYHRRRRRCPSYYTRLLAYKSIVMRIDCDIISPSLEILPADTHTLVFFLFFFLRMEENIRVYPSIRGWRK